MMLASTTSWPEDDTDGSQGCGAVTGRRSMALIRFLRVWGLGFSDWAPIDGLDQVLKGMGFRV